MFYRPISQSIYNLNLIKSNLKLIVIFLLSMGIAYAEEKPTLKGFGEKFFEVLDQEVENIDAGHEAVIQSENRKSFSSEYLENCYADDPNDEEQGNSKVNDHLSTFDEANYNPLKTNSE